MGPPATGAHVRTPRERPMSPSDRAVFFFFSSFFRSGSDCLLLKKSAPRPVGRAQVRCDSLRRLLPWSDQGRSPPGGCSLEAAFEMVAPRFPSLLRMNCTAFATAAVGKALPPTLARQAACPTGWQAALARAQPSLLLPFAAGIPAVLPVDLAGHEVSSRCPAPSTPHLYPTHRTLSHISPHAPRTTRTDASPLPQTAPS